jgi:hypothetical protein
LKDGRLCLHGGSRTRAIMVINKASSIQNVGEAGEEGSDRNAFAVQGRILACQGFGRADGGGDRTSGRRCINNLELQTYSTVSVKQGDQEARLGAGYRGKSGQSEAPLVDASLTLSTDFKSKS